VYNQEFEKEEKNCVVQDFDRKVWMIVLKRLG
jgi:hypothetical protein